jgi:hypothetical protein
MLFPSKRGAESARDDLGLGATYVAADELEEKIGSSYYAGVDSPHYFTVQPARLAGHFASEQSFSRNHLHCPFEKERPLAFLRREESTLYC